MYKDTLALVWKSTDEEEMRERPAPMRASGGWGSAAIGRSNAPESAEEANLTYVLHNASDTNILHVISAKNNSIILRRYFMVLILK